MSFTLLSSTKPKARKSHTCIWCGESIEKGDKYIREKSVYDGEMQNFAWHNECLPVCHKELKDNHDDTFDPYENTRPTTV